MRDAVLVLTPQAERRADLGGHGVAAALAAGDHDDPALDAVALVPHAARPDDAGVVVGMGPFAHDVDLHGLVGRVRRRAGAAGTAPSSDRQGRHRTTPNRLTSLPPHSHLFARLRTGTNPAFSPCQVAAATLGCRALRRAHRFSPRSARARERPRRPDAGRRPRQEYGPLRRGAHGRRHAASTAPSPLGAQEVVLEGRRYPYEGSYRVIARTTTNADGQVPVQAELDRNHRLRVIAPAQAADVGACCRRTRCRRSSCASARCARAWSGSTSATRCPRRSADARPRSSISARAAPSARRCADRRAQARARPGATRRRSTVTLPDELARRVPLRVLLPRLAGHRDGRPGREVPEAARSQF